MATAQQMWLFAAQMIETCLSLPLFFILLSAAATDLRKQIIPDGLNMTLAALGVAATLTLQVTSQLDAAAGLVLGAAVPLAMRVAYFKLRGQQGLGLGDVKFLGAAGLWVGVSGLPFVVLIASLSGIAAAVLMRTRKLDFNSQSRLPFAPHLALGLFATWLCRLYGLV
jgi:leader peptidase (prepilin peptidase) / N-methyltransferase